MVGDAAGDAGGAVDLGGDDVEDPATDPAELLGPELRGPGDQVGLGHGNGVGVHRARQRVQGAVDDVGLRQRRLALAHRGRQHRVVPIQRRGQGEVGARVGVPGAGLLRQPPRRVLRGRVLREVAAVGEDPQPQLGQLALGTDQLGERGRLVVGRHERRVRIRHRLERGPDVGDGSNDRMRHARPPLDDGPPRTRA